jgi:beta-barrel assembly-enhancing protease
VYSVEKERALAQHAAAEIRRHTRPLADPTVDAYVNRVGAELTRQVKEALFPYRFEVIWGGDQTEPMPLLAGNILIPARSFVAVQDEAEFIGLLAHSIGHAALRHITRTATRGQVGNTASIPLIFMGGWGGSHVDSQRLHRAAPVALLEFQRDCELEADRFGMELAARAGYDAAGYLR